MPSIIGVNVAPNPNDYQSNIPVGTVIQFASSTAPSGYLNCDGSAINRNTYSALFSLIGTTYGSGNAGAVGVFSWTIVSGVLSLVFSTPQTLITSIGTSFIFDTGFSIYSALIATSASPFLVEANVSGSNTSSTGGTVQLTTPTTFNLPNTVGVTIRGSGTSWNIGTTGGADTTTLVVANVPSHIHTTQMPGSVSVSSGGNGALGNQFNAGYYNTTAAIYDSTGTLVTAAGGTPTSFSVINKYLVLNYCIKY